jgi:putative DNA primase/helicase
MVPRPQREVSPTISLYHTIDEKEPTLFIDEGGELFRNRELKKILNNSWTPGFPVYRMARGGIRRAFRVFCPKAIGLLGRGDIPPDTATRFIFIEMQAPTAEEARLLERVDWTDPEFGEIRLKAARWSADNMAALKDATPAMPIGFVNRLADNWSLMFGLADLVGGEWPERLRRAAMQLAPTDDDQNMTDSKRLLAELRVLFEQVGRPWVTSEQVAEHLTQDPLGPWAEHHGLGLQRRVAHLLRKAYQIRPHMVGPEHGSALSRRVFLRWKISILESWFSAS